MKKLQLIFVFLFLVCIVFAQDKKIDFSEYDLNNGLHVILHQDNSAPIVVVSVLYHVGSKNESPGHTGYAHFFEHLMFEGSKYIKRGEFDSLVTNAGGVNNAHTSFDETYYYEVFPSNQLKLGLYLESERMLHAKIDSIGVDTQREVVKEEKRLRYDNQPYGNRWVEIFKRAFTVHPYHWMPIGSMEDLNVAQLGDFMDFYKTFYVPQNATLSIAGDINIDEAKKQIDAYFANIPKGPKKIPRPDVVEPPQKAEIRDIIYDNVQLPMVLQAYHIPSETAPDYYAVEMLTKILADGQSSRLYKELVDKKQLALTSGAFAIPTEDPGLFIALALSNSGIDAQTLEQAMNEEIEKVKNNLITEREFEKIRNQVENDLVDQNATQEGIAENLANYYTFYHNTNMVNDIINKYMAVTREDIQNVAQKYLAENNRVVLYYLPKSEEAKDDDNN